MPKQYGPFKAHSGVAVLWSAVGRTRVRVTCPFCQQHVETFLWSLAGSGKLCACGALLGQIGGFAPPQRKVKA